MRDVHNLLVDTLGVRAQVNVGPVKVAVHVGVLLHLLAGGVHTPTLHPYCSATLVNLTVNVVV